MDQSKQLTAASVGAGDGKIVCHIDNVRVHSIQNHITKNHPDWTIDRYKAEFPDEPLLSEFAKDYLAKAAKEKAEQAAKLEAAQSPAVALEMTGGTEITQPKSVAAMTTFHELFELGSAPAAMNARGAPIQIKVLSGHDATSQLYLPDVDKNYVYNIDLLKKLVLGLELNMPTLLWGFHGTGKTTIIEQACARTRRPVIRKQHTINMQESDVLGQWTVKDGTTHFQLGPLAMAMIYGWVYLADEYDFAMPSVLAVYQPVMEGGSLLIADAPPMFRKITPHPNFRFVATGNTNGTGDETGLYQGTLVQNAANYSRFKITVEVEYMAAEIEQSILIAQTKIDKPAATKIVKFANEIRKMFRDSKISMTISPRELISAADIGIAYGGNWSLGMELAYSNRLSRVDKEVVKQYMQRVFGGAA